MSGKKSNQKMDTAAALMYAIQDQGLRSEPKYKHEYSQTEPDERAKENDSIENKINRCLLLLSHVDAKMDVLASKQFQHVTITPDVILTKANLQPVKSLADLVTLEENCRDEDFVKSIIASVGNIHGRHRHTGNGATVSLQLIDYFFARDFLLKCSWTGSSRTSGEEKDKKQKIPFMKFDRTIDLFYQTVLNSDPNYTLADCKSFLHRCLKNAKQRFAEIVGTRKSVSRKRKRLTNIVNIEDHFDEARENHCSDDNSAGEKHSEGASESALWQIEFLDFDEEQSLEMTKIEK